MCIRDRGEDGLERLGRHEEMYDLMVRLGRLRLARLRDPRGGLDIFEDVLRRKQGHAGAIGALEERARHGGEELAGLLEEILPRASEDAARVAILRALGKAQEKLGHPAEAIDAWRRTLESVPSDSEAMGSLVQLYQAAGRAPELLEIYKRQLAISDEVAVRTALLFQIAALQDGALHDTVGAMATLRRLLELKPDDAQALEKLDSPVSYTHLTLPTSDLV